MGKISDIKPRPGDYLLSDQGSISTDTVTLASGHVYEPGQLLGQVTATKKFVPWAPAASDGSETAAGICFGRNDASTADVQAGVTARLAEVKAHKLILPSGATLADAAADLAAKFIVIRS